MHALGSGLREGRSARARLHALPVRPGAGLLLPWIDEGARNSGYFIKLRSSPRKETAIDAIFHKKRRSKALGWSNLRPQLRGASLLLLGHRDVGRRRCIFRVLINFNLVKIRRKPIKDRLRAKHKYD